MTEQTCNTCRHFDPPPCPGTVFGHCHWVDGMTQLSAPTWLHDQKPIREANWGADCRAWKPKDVKIYYMRDNHAFLPLPLDVAAAEVLLRKEFDDGYTYGTLCAAPYDASKLLHARGAEKAEAFFSDARTWIQRAIDLSFVHEDERDE